MNRFSKIVLLYACLLLPLSLLSQEDNFRLTNNKKFTVIPFKFINESIIIPLQINNSDTLFFMLDSGLTHTLITELFQEDSLQLNNFGKEVIKGLGKGRDLHAIISLNNEIKLKDIRGVNQRINLIEENIFNLSQLTGHKINGIIGYDFLKNFIVKINYQKQLLLLYDPQYYKKKLRRYTHLPLEIIAGKPYINTHIITPQHKKQNVKLMLDTGASLSLWLVSQKIPKPDKTVSSYLGEGLSGSIYGEFGRIPKLFLGKRAFEDVVTAFPYEEDIKMAVAEGRNGSIGNGILRRFFIVFDYPNKRVALKPNHFYNEPFIFNNSGIEVYQPNIHIPIYKIYSLRKGSPAAIAGLKNNDIILKINGKSTVAMSLGEVINTLKKEGIRKNRKIRLLIQRDDSQLNIEYKIPKEKIL